jgi:hypothetical protein
MNLFCNIHVFKNIPRMILIFLHKIFGSQKPETELRLLLYSWQRDKQKNPGLQK